MTGYDDAERIRKLERDVATLGRLCREQSAEIRVLRLRLRQIQSSRWRRLGQRLGLAMTMDWERTS